MVFAIASAFTTVNRNTASWPHYIIIGVPSQMVLSEDPDYGDFINLLELKIADLRDFPVELEVWYSAEGGGSFVCFFDPDYVCLAELELFGENVYDIKPGAFEGLVIGP